MRRGCGKRCHGNYDLIESRKSMITRAHVRQQRGVRRGVRPEPAEGRPGLRPPLRGSGARET